MRLPLNAPYRITTPFGVPDSNAKFGRHSGLDLVPNSDDKKIYAPVTGKVVFAGWSNTGGNMVHIFGGKYYHRLMHNSRLLVVAGQQVNEGQAVAIIGSTGLSTGVHCHWDIAVKTMPTSFSDFIDPSTIIGDEMIPDQDHLNALFRAFRGRNANATELQKYVGKITYDKMVEALDVGEERALLVRKLELGSIAYKDNWQKQIYDLQAALKAARDKLASMDNDDDQIKAAIAKLNEALND